MVPIRKTDRIGKETIVVFTIDDLSLVLAKIGRPTEILTDVKTQEVYLHWGLDGGRESIVGHVPLSTLLNAGLLSIGCLVRTTAWDINACGEIDHDRRGSWLMRYAGPLSGLGIRSGIPIVPDAMGLDSVQERLVYFPSFVGDVKLHLGVDLQKRIQTQLLSLADARTILHGHMLAKIIDSIGCLRRQVSSYEAIDVEEVRRATNVQKRLLDQCERFAQLPIVLYEEYAHECIPHDFLDRPARLMKDAERNTYRLREARRQLNFLERGFAQRFNDFS